MDLDSMRAIMTGESLVRKRRLLDALIKVTDADAFEVAYDALRDASDFIVSAALKVIDARSSRFPVQVKRIMDVCRSQSEKPHLRALGIRVLGNSENTLSIKTIVDALEDRDEMVQLEAVESIIKFRKGAVLPLINAITEEEAPWFKRERCALALSFLAGKAEHEVVPTLKNVLTLKGENVQFAVARAFKEIGNLDLFEDLKGFLKIETLENRVEIKRLLRTVSRKQEMEHLIASLAKMDEKLCLELIVSLKSSKKSLEHQHILERILKNAENKRMKAAIVRIMGLARNEKVVPILTDCLKDPDKRVRANTVEALADIGGEFVIELLRPMLNDYDNRVKANAAKGLWKLGGVRSLQILREMMENQDKWMRASAIYAMGEIGVMQVVELLLVGLSDPDSDVVINTARALVKTGDPMAVHAVIDLARNRSVDWLVRKNAIIALARTDKPEAMRFLKEIVNDESEPPSVKETVSVVLAEMEEA